MTAFAGTATLARFAVRRDRVVIPVVIAAFVGTVVASAVATTGLYPSEAGRFAAASAVNDMPAMVALYGRVWDPTSLGALVIMKLVAFGTAMVAVTAIMLVVRHTRAEEESGRLELIGATIVGRRAALSAAAAVAVGTMMLIGLLVAVGQIAAGLPAAGSWLFGASWAAAGMAFAGVAAVTAQLAVTARSATGSALALLGVAYVLRAIGDAGGGPTEPGLLSWLSPIGWAQQVRPYAGDRWWPLLPPLLFCALSVAAAYALAARRDLGAGLLPDRSGPDRASRWLGSPIGLAWRLQRGMLAAWAIGYVAFGFMFGSLASSAGLFFQTEQARVFIRTVGGSQALSDAFLATAFGFIAVLTAAYGVSVAGRLHGEEQAGHAELLLALAVSRQRWLVSHLTIAVLGTTALTLLAGASAGIADVVHAGTISHLVNVVGGSLVYLPAIWAVSALAVLIYCVVPRLAGMAWVVLIGLFLDGELAPLLHFPKWLMRLSPFAHIPKLPGADMLWGPSLTVLAVAAALALLGLSSFRHRDLHTA